MKALCGWNSGDMFIFLVLSFFTKITAGYITTPLQSVGKTSQQGLEGNTSRLRKNMISNAMFKRNARSITHRNNFFHHLHKQSKSTYKNEHRLFKHISKDLVHKKHDKSREVKKSFQRRIVKISPRKFLPKNTRRNKDIKSQNVVNKRKLRKKLKSQTLIKQKRKKVLERGNFNRKENFSRLIRTRLEGKYKTKNSCHPSNTRALLIPQGEEIVPQHSKPKRRQNYEHNRGFHRNHVKRDHKSKHNVLKTKEHQQKNNYRTSKFGLLKHGLRLTTPCHRNCLGLYLRMKGKSLRKKHRSKDTATPNIKRHEKITTHSTRLLEHQNHKRHSFRRTKHKLKSSHKSIRYSYFSKKRINKAARKKRKCRFSSKLCENHFAKFAGVHTKSKVRKVGGKHGQNGDYQTGLRYEVRGMNKHRGHQVFANKFRHQRKNNYKLQDKNRNTVKIKSSIKNNNTPPILCEENKKKMREMIIKMNKAVRRSIILARIIGGEFGIDDKTIAAILSKEEDNISRNVFDFKKESVNI